MRLCFIRLLTLFAVVLSLGMTPTAFVVTEKVRADACCERQREGSCNHGAHETAPCATCVACPTNVNGVVPVFTGFFLQAPRLLGQLEWESFVGETRTDPPPLPPPRSHPDHCSDSLLSTHNKNIL